MEASAEPAVVSGGQRSQRTSAGASAGYKGSALVPLTQRWSSLTLTDSALIFYSQR